MLGAKSPCYNCNRRHLACHDTCTDYIEAKAEHHRNVKKVKDKDGDRELFCYWHDRKQEKA